jgi:uncharacterized protein (DUF1684 family)
MTVQDLDRASFTAAWAQWHSDHETTLADPHGFLAVTALHWLSTDPQRFEDAPGLWSSGADGVVVELADGEELSINGVVVRGRYNFGVLAERTGINATFGDAVIEVAKRGGHDIVRPRHPEHALRTEFIGVPTFAPDPDWAVTGRYIAFGEPRAVTVGAAVEGLQHVYEAAGRVEFELSGSTFSLTAFNGRSGGSLMILFTDATSGVTTYAANRSLMVDAPDAAGRVTLDFNRATNLPCAYTDFATCPLPPTENRLPIAVDAGEQIPYERR